jgi:L-ribulose-5-phosphate 3-epimerase
MDLFDVMILGYNTNGLAHHDLFDAVELLAEIGYRSVAITIDHGALSPREDWRGQLRQLRATLQRLGLRSAIETGARFLLDPREKHEPTLLSADPAARARRVEFYKHAIRCAAELESSCVSLWSGILRQPLAAPGPIAVSQAMSLLTAGLEEVLRCAEQSGVLVGFEPEPGMLVDSMARFGDLLALVDAPNLKLTLDVGHLQCQGELPIANQIRRWSSRLVNVHLEDMRRGLHEHLMFGEGEIDFLPVLQTLTEVGYQGGIHVELSRHSHLAPQSARRAYAFVQPLTERIGALHG